MKLKFQLDSKCESVKYHPETKTLMPIQMKEHLHPIFKNLQQSNTESVKVKDATEVNQTTKAEARRVSDNVNSKPTKIVKLNKGLYYFG